MKKGFFIILFFWFKGIFLHAQISIKATDFPEKGDSVNYAVSTNFTNSYLATGPNHIWNFANLEAQSQTTISYNSIDNADFFTQATFGLFASPPYRATYYLPAQELPLATLANFANIPIDDIYRFYRKTDQEITVVGLSIAALGFAIGNRATAIEVAYKFPMVYGQKYTSFGAVNLDLGAIAPFALRQQRTRLSEVDGYGTITTPFGTFECLRIHHKINEIDSIYLSIGNNPIWLPIPIPTIHEYEWFTTNQKGPILKVKANEIFGNVVVNEVIYRDKKPGNINLEPVFLAKDDELIVFPNPTTDFLKFNANLFGAQVQIFDMHGKLAYKSLFNTVLDIRNLQSGVYFLQIMQTNKVELNKKFVKF